MITYLSDMHARKKGEEITNLDIKWALAWPPAQLHGKSMVVKVICIAFMQRFDAR
jgi:hypothetical protein